MPQYKMVNELNNGTGTNTWVGPVPSSGMRSLDRNLPMMKQEATLFHYMISEGVPTLETPLQTYRVSELMDDGEAVAREIDTAFLMAAVGD